MTNDDKDSVLKTGASLAQKSVGSSFVKLESEERKQQLMRSTPHSRHPSVLWTKDRSLTKKFFVKRYVEYTGVLECEFAGRASKVMAEVDRELDLAGVNDFYVNLRCDESILFFRLRRREVKNRDGVLLLQLPPEVFEIQRRAQLRYQASAADRFQVSSSIFPANARDVRLLDVSSGGVGIQLRFGSDVDADAFSPKIEGRFPFRFDLVDLSLDQECEIRYSRRVVDELDGSPAVRIGVRMVGLPEAIVDSIQNLVLERSYERFKDMQTP